MKHVLGVAALLLMISPQAFGVELEGYRDTKWGMTMGEVKELYPGATAGRKSSLVVSGSVAGYEALTIFHFTEDQLTNVGISFKTRYADGDSYIGVYREIGQLLAKKYGKATKESETGRSPWGSERRGDAVKLCYIRLLSVWDLEGTEIRLSCGCHGELGDGASLILYYYGKAFKGLEEKKQMDDL